LAPTTLPSTARWLAGGGTNDNIRVPSDVLATLTVTSLAVFRPSAHQAVLVVAVEEPEHAEAVLRPICGDRLCVVRSRWTKEQLDGASQRLQVRCSVQQRAVTGWVAAGRVSDADDGRCSGPCIR
jgi:hypothetical protein